MKQYVVDAFADKLFEGNPAAICVMEKWLKDELMQAITIENNLSETAFTVKEGKSYRLRWFTPGGEIDLCGHATLATAFVLMNYVDTSMTEVFFQTLSGELIVNRKDDLYEMDFPSYQLKPIEVTDQMEQIIGFRPLEAWIDRDLVCILENEEQVKAAHPDLEKTKLLSGLLLHLTAKGTEYDCVSRSFAPKLSVPEDPVCGSGHCHIAPLWSDKLGKAELVARQASRRGGTLYCRVNGGRVQLAGKAALYSVAELSLPDAPT
ncbi:PhzF family phenazine biosynthesis protein [Desulfosporosinus sp. BICA1-9]|uniref:PhzF family phenazine biosynthesis protein n=1 Tax=Desulfosporosinus sp. BICA1-9 TaxID=1531958 RepID=UPI00054B4249|nr:PhzF family phenazine biosynthesis protein [Desulfosporosinus sp. BICA1-9]KJS89732.1 MAG: phenazine biosynthesis protein [Desulfosporosinus sp. BICA1-9]HBW38152.1 PhzF family phenazine biosynthesis protein [Desulfosporosinus sp.]